MALTKMGAADVISVQNVSDEVCMDQSMDPNESLVCMNNPGSNIPANAMNSIVTQTDAKLDNDLLVCVATNVPKTAAAMIGD